MRRSAISRRQNPHGKRVLEHRADAEERLEKARAGAEALNLDAYIAAVNADDACGQVKAVSAPSVDTHRLENDVERWTFTEAACLTRVKELERLADFVLIEPKIDAVVRAEADVHSLLDGFEELRAELDRRLSILTWLHTGRLIKEDDVEAVKSAIASCYVLPRDEVAVDAWRKAVKELENDADVRVPK